MSKTGKKNVTPAGALSWLAERLDALKHLPRTGWRMRGIREPESVAAHTTGVLVWLLWLIERHEARHPGQVDRAKALTMALIHDLPEASLGDLTPLQKALLFGPDPHSQSEGVTAAEGRFWQASPLALPPALPPPSPSFQEPPHDSLLSLWTGFFSLWEEYRSGLGLEVSLLKQADALDCVCQAICYKSQGSRNLEEFSNLIDGASPNDPELRAWLSEAWKQATS